MVAKADAIPQLEPTKTNLLAKLASLKTDLNIAKETIAKQSSAVKLAFEAKDLGAIKTAIDGAKGKIEPLLNSLNSNLGSGQSDLASLKDSVEKAIANPIEIKLQSSEVAAQRACWRRQRFERRREYPAAALHKRDGSLIFVLFTSVLLSHPELNIRFRQIT